MKELNSYNEQTKKSDTTVYQEKNINSLKASKVLTEINKPLNNNVSMDLIKLYIYINMNMIKLSMT